MPNLPLTCLFAVAGATEPTPLPSLPSPSPLTELVRSGAPSLNAVYNPARIGVVAIADDGAVSCSEDADAAARADPLACRDPRIALALGRLTPYHHDGVIRVGGDMGRSEVVLHLGAEAVQTWRLDPERVPLGCGMEGHALLTRHLTLDLTCRGDRAVVRWVIWRSFLARTCDEVRRSTRAIGPDLRCVPTHRDEHAQVLESGQLQLDLAAGAIVSEP